MVVSPEKQMLFFSISYPKFLNVFNTRAASLEEDLDFM